MTKEILILEGNKGYSVVNSDKEDVKKRLHEWYELYPQISGDNDQLLDALNVKSNIPTGELKNYGATIKLKKELLSYETYVDGLSDLFHQALGRAELHNADYALIQEIKINRSRFGGDSVSGLMQLLMKEK